MSGPAIKSRENEVGVSREDGVSVSREIGLVVERGKM